MCDLESSTARICGILVASGCEERWQSEPAGQLSIEASRESDKNLTGKGRVLMIYASLET